MKWFLYITFGICGGAAIVSAVINFHPFQLCMIGTMVVCYIVTVVKYEDEKP